MSASPHHSDVKIHVWASSRNVRTPEIDVLEYVFGRIDQYHTSRPIFIDAIDPTNNISASQAFDNVSRLIDGLRSLGLRSGDCVCLHAFNSIWYPILWLAVIGVGARVVGSNPRFTKSELVHVLELTKPKIVFAQTDCISTVIQAIAAPGAGTFKPPRIFTIESHASASIDCHKSWRTLLEHEDVPVLADTHGPTTVNPCRTAMYAMTSGTTGRPKAAMVGCNSVVAQSSLIEEQFSGRTYQPSQLICLPIFHAFAAPVALVLPLRLGMPTYFLPKWSLPEYVGAIERFSITDTPVCPPIIGALTQLAQSEHQRLKSLRYVVSAGAALPAIMQNKLSNMLAPDAVVAQCLGTTETGWITLGDWQDKDISGSVGHLLPNVQMKLVSGDGTIINEDGVPGEACIKTPVLFSGYLDAPDADKDAFDADGYYRTGDRVYCQAGRIYYQERMKETLKVKGWQVSPTELESILMGHAGIADCAVAGLEKDNGTGIPETFPSAYIVRASGAEGSALKGQTVKDFVAARVVSYKRLTGGVVFVKRIPRSPAGKILRRMLPTAEVDLTMMKEAGIEAHAAASASI